MADTINKGHDTFMRLSEQLAPHLPYLRRHARALVGSQASGDAYVVATLESIIAAPEEFPHTDVKVGLYRMFHAIWSSASVEPDAEEGQEEIGADEGVAQRRLSKLTPLSRQAFLLTILEGFNHQEVATILGLPADGVDHLITEAVADIERQTTTSVLIIEDEPIIAMDLKEIVDTLGHRVTAIAPTRTAAVKAARKERPGLVLADIRLADGSSGIDAVRDILGSFEVPVIFITAYPEQLLTGLQAEPTFLITKPFQADTVKAAISQALFFERSARLT